jgi:hypothetical protein
MADLLPDAKKAYYEQEGKQFIFEPAWQIVKNLAKNRPAGMAMPSHAITAKMEKRGAQTSRGVSKSSYL